jgi:hypothetical protein
MAAFVVAAFLLGITLLGFVVIVVETWWVVALVGTAHIVASVALGVLVIRTLKTEERPTDDRG